MSIIDAIELDELRDKAKRAEKLEVENRVLKSTLSAIRLYCSNHAFGGWRHDIAGMIDKVH